MCLSSVEKEKPSRWQACQSAHRSYGTFLLAELLKGQLLLTKAKQCQRIKKKKEIRKQAEDIQGWSQNPNLGPNSTARCLWP